MKQFILGIGAMLIVMLFFSFIMMPLLLIFFIPVLPIMLLAFPMMVMNHGTDKIHWSQKPYLWYFNKVWLKALDALTF